MDERLGPMREPTTASRGGGAMQPGPQERFLEELLEEHATIAGDVIEIGAHTWAIHGSIATDGEVIMAEYGSEEQARAVLDGLPGGEMGPVRR